LRVAPGAGFASICRVTPTTEPGSRADFFAVKFQISIFIKMTEENQNARKVSKKIRQACAQNRS
jgi:hypothetical protein